MLVHIHTYSDILFSINTELIMKAAKMVQISASFIQALSSYHEKLVSFMISSNS